ADEIGEGANEQRLLNEPGNNVLVCAPGPEQAGQREVDGGKRGRQESDFAAEQPEATIDIAREDFQKPIKDSGAAHWSIHSAVLELSGGLRRFGYRSQAMLPTAARETSGYFWPKTPLGGCLTQRNAACSWPRRVGRLHLMPSAQA